MRLFVLKFQCQRERISLRIWRALVCGTLLLHLQVLLPASAAHPTTTQGYVAAAYKALLLRPPTTSEIQTELKQLKAANLSYFRQAYMDVIMTPEFRALMKDKSKAQRLTLIYQRILGRKPDPAGLKAWLAGSMLNNTTSDSLPEIALIGVYSAEFAKDVGFQPDSQMRTIYDYEIRFAPNEQHTPTREGRQLGLKSAQRLLPAGTNIRDQEA